VPFTVRCPDIIINQGLKFCFDAVGSATGKASKRTNICFITNCVAVNIKLKYQ